MVNQLPATLSLVNSEVISLVQLFVTRTLPSTEHKCKLVVCHRNNAYIEESDKIQHTPVPPDDPDCKHKKAVAVVMLWSDATHLANFGMAKLWPIYMLLRNLSKYFCSLPNSGACQHIAYIPLFQIISKTSQPDSIRSGEHKRRIL